MCFNVSETCDKKNGNSDCTKNTCHRHDFGPIHYAMRCLTRNGQDGCYCGATYSHHHGGGHTGGGPKVPDLGNILSAGQIVRITCMRKGRHGKGRNLGKGS